MAIVDNQEVVTYAGSNMGSALVSLERTGYPDVTRMDLFAQPPRRHGS